MRKRKKTDGRGRTLRIFAWVLALILAVAGWIVGGNARLGLILELSAAVVFAVGTTWPYAFDRPYRLLGPARKPRLGDPG
jgi:hypothetical protein